MFLSPKKLLYVQVQDNLLIAITLTNHYNIVLVHIKK